MITKYMSENIKHGINNYLAPILITIIGFFIMGALNDIREDIRELKTINVERDIWVRDWIEKWQPTLEWAKIEKDKSQRD